MNAKYFFIFLFLIVIAFSVSGAPPTTQIATGSNVLNVIYPKVETLIIGKTYDFEFHVFNANGTPLRNNTVKPTFCNIHIYKQDDGEHLIKAYKLNMGGDRFDYEYKFTPTAKGKYSYITWCNNSQAGGFVSNNFEVTADGNPINYGKNALIYFGYLLIVFILFFLIHTFKDDEPTLMVYSSLGVVLTFIMVALQLGGFSVFYGLKWILNVDYYLTALTVVIGLYFVAVGFMFYSRFKGVQS